MTGTSSACPTKTLMVRGSHYVRDGKRHDSSGCDTERETKLCPRTGMGKQSRRIQKMNPTALEPHSFYFETTRLFVTENTFGTPFARSPARFLSVSLSATPSSDTFPFFTMMWIDGTADRA